MDKRILTFVRETGIAFLSHLRVKLILSRDDNGMCYNNKDLTEVVTTIRQLDKCHPVVGRDLDRKFRPWCVEAIKTAVTIICATGPTILKEATFNLLEC